MVLEGIDIITSKAIISIRSCKVEVPVNIKGISKIIRYPVYTKSIIIVPPYSETQIPVYYATLPDRNFLFEPTETPLSLYAHLIDSSISAVLAKNNSDVPIKIPRNLKLGTVCDTDFDNCFQVTTEDAVELTTRRPTAEHKASWIKRVYNKVIKPATTVLLAATATASSVPNLPDSVLPNSRSPDVAVNTTPGDVIMPNGVTVFGASKPIQAVIDRYPTLWQERGFAKVPEEDWMRIPLRTDWEEKIPKTPRVYPLSNDAKAVVNKTFDKLYS